MDIKNGQKIKENMQKWKITQNATKLQMNCMYTCGDNSTLNWAPAGQWTSALYWGPAHMHRDLRSWKISNPFDKLRQDNAEHIKPDTRTPNMKHFSSGVGGTGYSILYTSHAE